MGLARGVVIQPTTFQLPKLQLPFEQMQAQMQGFQQEKDVYDTMKDMSPSHVEGDKPLVQAAIKQVKNLVGDVSEQFASGKVSDAMRGIRTGKGVLSEMWKPTGVFGGVQAYYDEYQKALKEVDDFTKGNTDPAYNYVYKRMVQESVKEGSGYDLKTGKRRSVSAPNMLKELDIIEDFQKKFPNWKDYSDISTKISRYSGTQLYQETTETVNRSEIEDAWNSYIKSPEVQAHLRIQAEYQSDIAGKENQDEYRKLLVQEAKNNISEVNSRIKSIEDALNSNVPASVRNAQRALGVKVDGVAGTETKKALETLKEKTKNKGDELEKSIKDADIVQLYQNRIEDTMGESIFNYYSMNRVTGKLITDQAALARYKYDLQKKLYDYEYQAANRTSFEQTGVLDTLIQDIGGIYAGQKKNYEGVYQSILSEKNNPLLNSAVRSFSSGKRFGVFLPHMTGFIVQSFEDGKFNKEKFKALMTKAGYTKNDPGYKGTKMTLDELASNIETGRLSFDDIQGASETISSAYRDFADTAVGFQNAVNELDKGINGFKWEDISLKKSIRPTHATGESSGFINVYYTPDELKKEFMSGNQEVIQAVSEKIGVKNLADMFSFDKMYSFSGGAADYYDKQQLSVLQKNPLAITSKLNVNSLSKNTMEALGINRQANGMFTIDPSIQFTNISNSSAFVNGHTQNFVSLTFVKGDKDNRTTQTIQIPREGWNPEAYNESMLAIGSSTIDKDGRIRDEAAFMNLSAQMFDRDNSNLGVTMTPGYMISQLKNGKSTSSINRIDIGIPADLSQGLLSKEGQIFHVYGIEADDKGSIYNAFQKSNGDYNTFMNIISQQGLIDRVRVGSDVIGTYQVDSEGRRIEGGKIHTDYKKMNNSIFEMVSLVNAGNALSQFQNELQVKRVPGQALGVKYSTQEIFNPNEDIYEDEQ